MVCAYVRERSTPHTVYESLNICNTPWHKRCFDRSDGVIMRAVVRLALTVTRRVNLHVQSWEPSHLLSLSEASQAQNMLQWPPGAQRVKPGVDNAKVTDSNWYTY